jgi:flagellar hook-associated protein 1 FlgK
MSFLGINIAGSALEAYQTAENVTSQNISDVSVTGASRQIVNFTEAPPVDGSGAYPGNFSPGTQGTGVLVSSITRVHQDSYDALFRGATSSQNYYSVEQSSLSALQSALGEPSNGINTAYSNFQTAVQTLVNDPSGSAQQSGLLTSAQALVVSLNSASSAITSQQTQVQNQAASYISTINSTLDQIAALNGQIRAATAVGNNPNTYKDQRDQLIDTLSTYVPVQTSVQADGSTLVTVDGKALVNDTVDYHLAAPVVGTSSNGSAQLVVGFANDPNPTNPTPVTVTGGMLGGLLDVYNNKLTSYSNSLNAFAAGLATESDRISQAGYDSTGAAGSQLFAPVVSQLPVSAGNIQVGIDSPSQVPSALASTASGNLVVPLNAANSTVDTSAQLTNNTTLNSPPAATLNGTLTIGIDGITQTYTYNTGAGGNADTVSNFINSFNAGQYGVTASYNSTSQTVVFTADPTNVSLVFRAEQQAAGDVTTPDFTITDSNAAYAGAVSTNPPGNATAAPPLGTPSTSLLGALGASAISSVDQNATNAYGSTNGAGANALLSIFSNNLGAPPIQAQVTLPTAVAANSSVTVTGPAATPPSTTPPFATINVGDVLTIYDGNPPTTANQENVTVTAVNRTNNTITFTVKNARAAGTTINIAAAQTQTLQTYYANFVAQLGLDTQTATTGTTTQTNLASSINTVRQSTDGINIDEETQNLIMYQNAYAAAAHTVDVLSQMLQTVINMGN